jgi:ribosomal protein S18 acetylase RimI-like enzyme
MRKTLEYALKLVPAAELSFDRLARFLNLAYDGYYFPIHLNVTQFEWMCYQEDIDLGKSVVAMVGEQPIGIALLSIRGRSGWVSGVGVMSSMRRRGVAAWMLRHVQATAQAESLQTLQLEVLVQNKAGLALYQQAGFVPRRDLEILLLEMWDYRSKSLPESVVPADPLLLLASYDALRDIQAPWQRQRPSLERRASELHGLALLDGDRLTGYLLYDGQFGTYSILDIAVDPAHPRRIEAAQALLQAAYLAQSNIRRYVINNLPDDDPLLPAFTEIGYGPWYRQHELVWRVS